MVIDRYIYGIDRYLNVSRTLHGAYKWKPSLQKQSSLQMYEHCLSTVFMLQTMEPW